MKTSTNILLSFSLLIAGLLFALPAQAQRTQQQEADLYFNRMDYYRALPLYEDLASNKKTESPLIVRRVAYCAKAINDYEKAEAWYARVVSYDDATANEVYAYAQLLRTNKKYAESDTWMQKYNSMDPNSTVAKNYNQEIGKRDLLYRDSAQYAISAMDDLNSPELDFSPFIAGNTFYFASSRKTGGLFGRSNDQDGSYYTHVYQLPVADTAKKQPQKTGLESDSKYHIGPVSLSANGEQMFITKSYPAKKVKPKDSLTIAHLELVTATRQSDGTITNYQPFQYGNDSYSIGQASISQDGNTLYFTSDMPGSLGATDIWRCTRNGSGWSAPENLGPPVNTEGKEMFPSILQDGRLVFASEGHGGLGGLDIFVSDVNGAGFGTPVNMGYPLNTSYDDFGLVLDSSGSWGYFSSNRPGGKGLDDLYRVRITPLTIAVQGQVLVRTTLQPVRNARVVLLGPNGEIDSVSTDTDGNYAFISRRGELEGLQLRDSADVYVASPATVNFTTEEKNAKAIRKNLYVDLLGKPVAANVDTIANNLQRIYYDFDKSNIRSEYTNTLDKLATWLLQHPTERLEINSYADCRGTDAYNQSLGERRSQSVVNYLSRKGVRKNRLAAKSYGESRPANNCNCRTANGSECSEAEHQQNRRSELGIIKINP